MKRKLMLHGLSSLTVSLPSSWVKENNLKKGDEIDLVTNNKKLLLSTEKHNSINNKVELNISSANPLIRKIIGAAFKSGYEEIDITFSTFDELKVVQELMREQFSGFEILNQTKSKILIKNLSKSSFQEFDIVLRRFFFVLNDMSGEFREALEKDDFHWLKNTSLLKIESDKFADYCRRAINKGSEIKYARPAPLYTIIEQLEKVVDRYYDLCIHISKNKLLVSTKIKSLSSDIVDFQNNFTSLFYKFDMDEFMVWGKKKEIIQDKLDVLAKNCSREEEKVLFLLDRILNLVFDINGPLLVTFI